MPEFTREAGRVLGYRSVLTVPMLHDSEAVGAITVTRREPGSFTDAEVALLKTFADQALIAVENVRLFKELQARAAALTRSVEPLTALGEAGRTVSSTLDLETVLATIMSRAVQLSGLDGGVVFEYDKAAEEFVPRAMTDTSGAAQGTSCGVCCSSLVLRCTGHASSEARIVASDKDSRNGDSMSVGEVQS